MPELQLWGACTHQVARSTPVAAGQWGSNGTAHRTGPGQGALCPGPQLLQYDPLAAQHVLPATWCPGRDGCGLRWQQRKEGHLACTLRHHHPRLHHPQPRALRRRGSVDWGGDIPGLRCTNVPTWYVSAATDDNVGTLQPSPAMSSLIATTRMDLVGRPPGERDRTRAAAAAHSQLPVLKGAALFKAACLHASICRVLNSLRQAYTLGC